MAAPGASGWKPYESLTQTPTNLKEAIDWVLRVTGRDGKKNAATKSPQKPASPPQFSCICFLAKAVKDLLYDARSPGSPGPHPERYWNDLLLDQESTIVHPVLQDLGLVNSDSTGAASSTCAGGTEVIRTLIDQLAQGLQKWVGWQDKGDECCLEGTEGIGKGCKCVGGAGTCCGTGAATTCHECTECGTVATGGADTKCYLSAYCKATGQPSSSPENYLWTTISSDSEKVHLLARIFLGSVCLIWSGLCQLGWLTKEGSGGTEKRWKDSKLHDIGKGNDGLGSFMAAMGYDLERLNQGSGYFLWNVLAGKNGKPGAFNEFTKDSPKKGSVAEYYSSIYDKAKGALKSTEDICKQYPLLVLHILASGYFRAGSAGAKGIMSPPKAAQAATSTTSDTKKDTPRTPRTIREILYWLSALPYSQGYCGLVTRMKEKAENVIKGGNIALEGDGVGKQTDLKKCCIPYYLLAACGYCPLVLIGIQGTIATSGTEATPSGTSKPAVKCEQHKEDRNHRCVPKNIKEQEEAADQAPASAGSAGQPLEEGQVCYGGYHLEVKDFGPLHGMYANGLFGFQMDISPAQCLDQLRTYVYHCFYQLYFLRKQCSTAVEVGVGGAGKTVLGWNSCRYGSGVYWTGGYSPSNLWKCKTEGTSNGQDHSKKCGLQDGASGKDISPLMCYLCDGVGSMACDKTRGKGSIEDYPSIEDHMNMESPIHPTGHLKMPQGHCPVPMGWKSDNSSSSTKENHFKDLTKGTHKTEALSSPQPGNNKYPAHCTGNTLSHLLEYYCDPDRCHGTLVVLLRLLACITPTVPRTLGDLFGFYYYIVYIGGKNSASGGEKAVQEALGKFEKESKLYMPSIGGDAVVKALTGWTGDCNTGTQGTLKCLYKCDNSGKQCSQYLSPLSGQQYGQLSPVMAGTYLSWLVYLIGEFQGGLDKLKEDYMNIQCKDDCQGAAGGAAAGCGGGQCRAGSHGTMCSTGGSQGVCKCTSVVSCTGVLPVLYRYGFGYGDVSKLHDAGGTPKKCDHFLETLKGVLEGNHLRKEGSSGNLHHEINQLIYTTRLPWIFVLTVAWLVAVLYLAFGAIWPLDWTHMRSHCRGWFRKGSLSPWEVLMVGKKKGRGILEFFGKT